MCGERVTHAMASSVPRTRLQQRIVIYASELGTALGLNPYGCPKDVARRLVQTRYPALRAALGAVDPVERSKESLKRAARAAPENVVASAKAVPGGLDSAAARALCAAVQAADESRARATAITADSTATPAEVERARRVALTTAAAASARAESAAEQLLHAVSSSMTATATAEELRAAEQPLEAAMAELRVAAKSRAYTSRGKRDEASALDTYGAARGVAVSPGDNRFKCLKVDGDVWVGGKEDGRHADGSAVVEIKRRQSRFFNVMPVREWAQLYVYMYVTGIRTGVWVQYFDGKVRYEDVPFEEDHWRELVQRLKQFAAKVRPFLESEDAGRALRDAPNNLDLPMAEL